MMAKASGPKWLAYWGNGTSTEDSVLFFDQDDLDSFLGDLDPDEEETAPTLVYEFSSHQWYSITFPSPTLVQVK